MKLWKISQSVNNEYDTYDSAVVLAETEDEARNIHPGGEGYMVCSDLWCDPANVQVEYIGEYAGAPRDNSVIVASFNAG